MLYEYLSALISKIKTWCKRGRNELKRESVASLSALPVRGGEGRGGAGHRSRQRPRRRRSGTWASCLEIFSMFSKSNHKVALKLSHRCPKLSRTCSLGIPKLSESFHKVVQSYPEVVLESSKLVSELSRCCHKVVPMLPQNCVKVALRFTLNTCQ